MWVTQDSQDSQVLRVIQDRKEKKAKQLGLRVRWVPRGTRGPEGSLEEAAWMEFLGSLE